MWTPRKNTSLFLLLSVLFFLAISPLATHSTLSHILYNVATTTVLLIAVYSLVTRKKMAQIGTAVAIPYFIFTWLSIFPAFQGLSFLHRLFAAGFDLFMVALLLSYVLRGKRTSKDRIYAAITAYLFLGIMWASLFGFLLHLEPAALVSSGTAPLNKTVDVLYFSFVTLTTLGYGDIVPVSAWAKTLAYLEAICGVLFLATFVARLVAQFTSPKNN